MRVFRTYWYSGVPSSTVSSRARKSLDNSRASAGATRCGASMCGSTAGAGTAPTFDVVSGSIPAAMVLLVLMLWLPPCC
ncbi:hypothetical protein BG653_07296 [Streptomyces platensis]|uniref:Uncharacterized protein n=1 Tax=Streptomyces platensis TaxID=58346 RepID=A0ABX3XKE6_STRPT|nr:hypothetical protein BG653_07296 [Streptomyces platensis]